MGPAPQLSLISQNVQLLRKVPAPTAASPPVSGMEDAEPGWPPPSFPPGFSNPGRGGLGSLLQGSAALEAPTHWQGQPLDESQKLPREDWEVLLGV